MAVAPAAPATADLPVRRRVEWPGLFKDATVAALLAGLLGLPFIGLETYNIGGGALGVRTHFDRLALVVAIAFAGRFAVQLFRQRRYPGVSGGGRPLARAAAWSSRRVLPITLIGVAFAVALPFLPFSSRYLVDLGTTVLIYVMLGWGLNIVVGLAGLLDLGYVAFYAVGAYTFALLAQNYGFGFWEALPFSGVMAALFGILLGFPVLRLRGDYLAIVTLGFGEIVRLVLLNWAPVTGGPNGLPVPRPTFFGLPFARGAPDGGMTFADLFGIEFSPDHRVIFLYYLILVLALITNFFTLRIRRLPVGRAWEALREDEIACRALGINPTSVKLSAFAIGAMFGGFAGCFFATRQGFISPESFTFIESATILAIVVLGGMGSQLGVVLAALVLVTLPEFGRAFAEFRMLVFGAAMVAIMVWRPRGLLAHRDPSVLLHSPAVAGATR
ncbi:MAG: high-affinity branched-chain amino acid ABC transporter permease LivM [Alphaproteobacteria bacterium]